MTRSIGYMPGFALTAACALTLAAPAQAEIITVEYEATLRPFLQAGWPADVVMSGTYRFDSEAEATQLGAGTAVYGVIESIATLDGIPFAAIDPTIIVRNDARLENGLARDNYLIHGVTQGTFKGITINSFGLPFEWDDDPNSALTDIKLPLSEEDLRFPPQARQAIITFRDPATGGLSATNGVLTRLEFLRSIRLAECDGFYDPFDAAGGSNRKTQPVVPLKTELFDLDGIELGPSAITTPGCVSQVRERERAGRTRRVRSSEVLRRDEATRRAVRAEYLDSIAAHRTGALYEAPGESVVAAARAPFPQ